MSDPIPMIIPCLPQPLYFQFPPLSLPFIIGIIFVVVAIKALDYTFDRIDNWFDVGIFGGFVVFAIGAFLVFVSFFPMYASALWFMKFLAVVP